MAHNLYSLVLKHPDSILTECWVPMQVKGDRDSVDKMLSMDRAPRWLAVVRPLMDRWYHYSFLYLETTREYISWYGSHCFSLWVLTTQDSGSPGNPFRVKEHCIHSHSSRFKQSACNSPCHSFLHALPGFSDSFIERYCILAIKTLQKHEFTIARTWKQPGCPLADDYIGKL